jgi:uncharacterized protein (TIGR03118 family)
MYHPSFFSHPAVKLCCLLSVVLLGVLALSGISTSASKPSPAAARMASDIPSNQQPEVLTTNNYRQTNLVSDLSGFAQIQDPNLVNPWGLAFSGNSPFWTSNQGSGTATLFSGDVNGGPLSKVALTVTIPGTPAGLNTGIVFNPTNDFVITSGGGTSKANFIFATLNGNIVAWRAGTVASIVATQAGHVYTGLAISATTAAATPNFLYAADFKNKKIDVYDKNFAPVTLAGTFTDTGAPAIPADFSPFNVQNLGGALYIAYAKVNPASGDDLPGVGNGFVSKFDLNGNFLSRVVSNGPLNSPWGMTIAPAGFGAFPGALLVGNFGDGEINAFNLTTGALLGGLNNEAGTPIIIPKLWAIAFGNGGGGGDTGALYFNAGFDDENHGLFGSLRPALASSTAIQFAVATSSVSETAGSADITVTRTGDLTVPSSVNYSTFDGTATQGSDYLLASGTLNFAVGDTSKTFTILVIDDAFVESDETVNLVLSNPTGASLGSTGTATLTITDNDTSAISPVQRTFISTLNGGNEVPPNTTTGHGVGIVQLAADELSAKVSVYFKNLTGNPAAGHIHGPAPVGMNANVIFPFSGLPASPSGSLNNFTITPNPTAQQVLDLKNALDYMNLHTAANPGGEIRGQLFYNPIDETAAFVREQYYDFLNRTPDAGGLAFWMGQIDACGADILCIEGKRIDVSREFFLSQEFQQTGFFVYRVRRASLGLRPTYGQYINDKSLLGDGTDANKTTFAEGFVQRPEFLAKYPATQSGSAFIDALIATINTASGVDLTSKRPELVNEYLLGATQTQSRARVIRKAIEYPEYTSAELNPAFVLAQYFGYLRRDPDTAGFNFWLGVLNANSSNSRGMVCSFTTSAEFQFRFGPKATRNDVECADVAP